MLYLCVPRLEVPVNTCGPYTSFAKSYNAYLENHGTRRKDSMWNCKEIVYKSEKILCKSKNYKKTC